MTWEKRRTPMRYVVPKAIGLISPEWVMIGCFESRYVHNQRQYGGYANLQKWLDFMCKSAPMVENVKSSDEPRECRCHGAEVRMSQKQHQKVGALEQCPFPSGTLNPLQLKIPSKRNGIGISHGIVPSQAQNLRMAEGQ